MGLNVMWREGNEGEVKRQVKLSKPLPQLQTPNSKLQMSFLPLLWPFLCTIFLIFQIGISNIKKVETSKTVWKWITWLLDYWNPEIRIYLCNSFTRSKKMLQLGVECKVWRRGKAETNLESEFRVSSQTWNFGICSSGENNWHKNLNKCYIFLVTSSVEHRALGSQ